VTVALGVALFGASYDAFGSLTASYRGLYDRLAMADLIATGGPAGQIADEGRRLDGVAAASARTVGETAMKVGDHRQYARIVGLALGYATAAAFMSSFSSDLFQFDLRIRPTTFVITAAAILAVGLVSQVPALRSIGRIDLGLVTRQRAS